MNEMFGRVGVNIGGLVGRKVRRHVSWLGILMKWRGVWVFGWDDTYPLSTQPPT